MLVARAFIFAVSGRAVLASAAVAASVAFALIAAGALSGLEGQGRALEEAREAPGYVLVPGATDAAGEMALRETARLPGAVAVWVAHAEGHRVATMDPWPWEPTRGGLMPYATPPTNGTSVANAVDWAAADWEFVPWDALVLAPTVYDDLTNGGLAAPPRLVFAPGTVPDTGIEAVPWRGVAEFFDRGVEQARSGLVAIVLISGAAAAFISSGLVYLEIMARASQLATLEMLGGERLVRRVVRWRVAVVTVFGLFLGFVFAIGGLSVVAGAFGSPGLAPQWQQALLVLAVVGGGGLIAGLLSASGALARSAAARLRTGGISVRRWRGPGRFLIVTPRLFGAIFAAALVSTAVISVTLGTAALPSQLLEGGGGEIRYASGSGNPLRTTADRFLAENVHVLEEVMAGVPETFAPSVWGGRPLMVLGTDHVAWAAYHDVSLRDGRWPTAPDEGTIGWRAARVHDIAVGDVLHLPAAYRRAVETVVVVGIHGGNGLEADELVVGSDLGGKLASLPPDRVNGVRIRLADGYGAFRLSPPTGIEVVSLEVVGAPLVSGASAQVAVDLVNFSPDVARRDLAVRASGVVFDPQSVVMEPHSRTRVHLPFEVPLEPTFEITVNPELTATSQPGSLDVRAPSVSAPGRPVFVRAEASNGTPLTDFRVVVSGLGNFSADAGRARFVPDAVGLYAIVVTAGEGIGTRYVRVVDPANATGAYSHVERVVVRDQVRIADGRIQAGLDITLANLGNVSGLLAKEVRWKGALLPVDPANISSAARATIRIVVIGEAGPNEFEVDGHRLTVQLAGDSVPAGEPLGSIDQVLARKRAAAMVQASDPVSQLQARVFQSLEPAATVVVLAAAVHGAALVGVAVVRELRERDRVAWLLQVMGASETAIRGIAARNAAIASIIPAALGTATAMAGLVWAGQAGFPAAFGHVMPSVVGWPLALRVAGALVFWAAFIGAARAVVKAKPRAIAPHAGAPLSCWPEAQR